MDGHRIVLNDGSAYENGRAGYSGGLLWLWFPGLEFWEVCDIARDADKMRRVVFQYGDMEETYEGFTTCTGVLQDATEVSLRMTKGE